MEVQETIIQLDSSWFSAEREVSRSKGLHLSHVIDYIEYCSGKRDSHKSPMGDRGHNYAAGGFLWERLIDHVTNDSPWELFEWMFTGALNDVVNPKVVRPGEQRLDCGKCPECSGTGEFIARVGEHGDECKACQGTGRVTLYLTPDGYHIEDECLEEWKYTSKSARNDIRDPKFRRWLDYQIPTYLKALGLRTCRLRVYFSRGDYTTGEPIWKEFLLTYSQTEIDDNWDRIANHAIEMYSKGIYR